VNWVWHLADMPDPRALGLVSALGLVAIPDLGVLDLIAMQDLIYLALATMQDLRWQTCQTHITWV